MTRDDHKPNPLNSKTCGSSFLALPSLCPKAHMQNPCYGQLKTITKHNIPWSITFLELPQIRQLKCPLRPVRHTAPDSSHPCPPSQNIDLPCKNNCRLSSPPRRPPCLSPPPPTPRANRRRQRQTIRYRGLVPPPPCPEGRRFPPTLGAIIAE